MAVPKTSVISCQHPTGCIMKDVKGAWDGYEVRDKTLLFRGEALGEFAKNPAEIICYEHCHERYLDEVVCAPVERKPTFNVVSRYSKEEDESQK